MGAATSAQTTLHIEATPEAVYDLVSDMPRVGEWSPECYRCEWIGSDGPAVGADFKGYNRVGPVRWSARGRVTTADRGREFAFVTLHKGRREETRWRYSFRANDGGTDVTESYEFIWAPWYIRFADLFLPRDRQLRRGMEQTLERIRTVAERITAH
jgi:hypothetical protein